MDPSTAMIPYRSHPLQAMPGEINYDPLDRYTFAHFGWGFVLGLLGTRWWIALGSALVWDLLERWLKAMWPGMWPHPSQDTPQHVAVDAAAWMMGWAVASQFVVGSSNTSEVEVKPPQAEG